VLEEIKKHVKEKLAKKEIELFIGYADATRPNRTKPAIIRKPEDVDQLVWNEHCEYNLVGYLSRFTDKKVGILVKPNDSRTLVSLLQEKRLNRKDLWILGVCTSGTNPREVEKPPLADVILESGKQPPCETADSKVQDEGLSKDERWKTFESEMSRCIRCYACRNACPLCYCEQCFVDQTMPDWMTPGNQIGDAVFFHIGRLMHLSGRCAECGACTRACPMDIPLDRLNSMAARFLEEKYETKAGMNADEPGALGAFSSDDDNSGFL